MPAWVWRDVRFFFLPIFCDYHMGPYKEPRMMTVDEAFLPQPCMDSCENTKLATVGLHARLCCPREFCCVTVEVGCLGFTGCQVL